MNRDKLGRERKRSQGGAGPKPLPNKTNGSITGILKAEDSPEFADKASQEFWMLARKTMEKLGILEKGYAPILEIAARIWGRIEQAREDIEIYGRVIQDDKGGIKRSPAMLTLEKAEASMKSYLSELGLTPSAQAKFGGSTEEEDPILQLLKRRA